MKAFIILIVTALGIVSAEESTDESLLSSFIEEIDPNRDDFFVDNDCNPLANNANSYDLMNGLGRIEKWSFEEFRVYTIRPSDCWGRLYRVSEVVMLRDGVLTEVMSHYYDIQEVILVGSILTLSISDRHSFEYELGGPKIHFYPE